jgi:hypothetical protein
MFRRQRPDRDDDVGTRPVEGLADGQELFDLGQPAAGEVGPPLGRTRISLDASHERCRVGGQPGDDTVLLQ